MGEIVEGKIVRMTNFGAFVELHEGIEGLVHISELDEKRVDKPDEAFKIGETYPMKIIKINQEEKKIGLSIRAVKTDEVQKDIEAYKEQATAPAAPERSTTTMGDAFRALARKREETDEDE